MTDPRITRILRDCAHAHAQEIAFNAVSAYDDLAAYCESPIERLLLAPLMFIKPQCLAPRYEGPADMEREARLYAQYPVGGRRLDFAYIVAPIGESWEIRLGIECDGHEFHASVEQRANDNLRGVEIMAEDGFNLIRFSGAQIHADPWGCAKRAADAVDGVYQANVFTHVNRTHGKAHVGMIGPLLAKVGREAGEAME